MNTMIFYVISFTMDKQYNVTINLRNDKNYTLLGAETCVYNKLDTTNAECVTQHVADKQTKRSHEKKRRN